MGKNIVITIARQYGSGGRTVGKMLAEELGIHYYDRELMKLASDESGINEELFALADEKARKSVPSLFNSAKRVYNGELISPESKDFTSDANLFNYQAKIIKDLASTSSCVIIGRCADFVLKDFDNVLSVFIHSPEEYLVQNGSRVLNMKNEKDVLKFIQRTDNGRAGYYKTFTGRDWTDARNYDLCLDSSKLGYEKCVDAIKRNLQVRFGDDIFEVMNKEKA